MEIVPNAMHRPNGSQPHSITINISCWTGTILLHVQPVTLPMITSAIPVMDAMNIRLKKSDVNIGKKASINLTDALNVIEVLMLGTSYQGLINVPQNIIQGFQAHTQSNQVGWHTCCNLLLFVQLPMGGGSGVNHQGFGVTDIGQMR